MRTAITGISARAVSAPLDVIPQIVSNVKLPPRGSEYAMFAPTLLMFPLKHLKIHAIGSYSHVAQDSIFLFLYLDLHPQYHACPALVESLPRGLGSQCVAISELYHISAHDLIEQNQLRRPGCLHVGVRHIRVEPQDTTESSGGP